MVFKPPLFLKVEIVPRTGQSMPQTHPDHWFDRFRQTLSAYDEPLLRQVAGKLIKPRSQWPVEELMDRMVEAIGNAPLIDRRLKELPEASRHILCLIDLSRQPLWHLGNLIQMVMALGHEDGLDALRTLMLYGLLVPEIATRPDDNSSETTSGKLKQLDISLDQNAQAFFHVFAHPQVTARLHNETIELPDWPPVSESVDEEEPQPDVTGHEADGMEWLLRLVILRQQAKETPLRLTQSGDLFKRDFDRMCSDPLLSAQPADSQITIPDIGLFTVALALAERLLATDQNDVRAEKWGNAWEDSLPDTMASLWSALPMVRKWLPTKGWHPDETVGNPFPSTYLLAMTLLAKQDEKAWTPVAELSRWMIEHHPYWQAHKRESEDALAGQDPTGLDVFLLGIAFHLRLVQVHKIDGEPCVRLSGIGRWLLAAGQKPTFPGFPQTMLVQPNLEILLYRQGLTPELVKRVGRFGSWKNLGAVCYLQLEADTVYMALEEGETFASILQVLDQHGIKETPSPIVESLRTWSQKRDRISVYPSAIVLEFNSEEDLQEAIRRGIPMVQVSDKLAVIVKEENIDYKHFRIAGSRDYTLPPEQCVDVGPDGVTLDVDLTRSDLLLDSEMERFAHPTEVTGEGNRRTWEVTPESLSKAADNGLNVDAMESWFQDRCGCPLPPAVNLLMTGTTLPSMPMRRRLIVQVSDPEVAEGLLQWPGTRSFFSERLGPTTLVVEEEYMDGLQERLASLGIQINTEE